MRCVPLSWCVPTKFVPIKVWDDSGGGGGRPGSVWIINSLDLIAVVAGPEPPKDAFYDLCSQRVFLDGSMISGLTSVSATAAGGKA